MSLQRGSAAPSFSSPSNGSGLSSLFKAANSLVSAASMLVLARNPGAEGTPELLQAEGGMFNDPIMKQLMLNQMNTDLGVKGVASPQANPMLLLLGGFGNEAEMLAFTKFIKEEFGMNKRKRIQRRARKAKKASRKRRYLRALDGLAPRIKAGRELIKKCNSGLAFTVTDAMAVVLGEAALIPQGEAVVVVDATTEKLQVSMGVMSAKTTVDPANQSINLIRPNMALTVSRDSLVKTDAGIMLNDAKFLDIDNETAGKILEDVKRKQMMDMFMGGGAGMEGMQSMLMQQMMMSGKDKITQVHLLGAQNPQAILAARLGKDMNDPKAFMNKMMIDQVAAQPGMGKQLSMMNAFGAGDFGKTDATSLSEIYHEGNIHELKQYSKPGFQAANFGCGGFRTVRNAIVGEISVVSTNQKHPVIIILPDENSATQVVNSCRSATTGTQLLL